MRVMILKMNLLERLAVALVSASVAMLAHTAEAEGFLFTEDADAGVERGDAESETWLEVMMDDQTQPLLNQELNLGVADGLFVGAGAGVGPDRPLEDQSLMVINPYLQAKWSVEIPGLEMVHTGLMGGAFLPGGPGGGEMDNPVGIALVPASIDLGAAAIHAHSGWAGSDGDEFENQLLVGAAVEVPFLAGAVLAEVVNRDPFEPRGAAIAQFGVNWGFSDMVETELLGLMEDESGPDDTVFSERGFGVILGLRLAGSLGQ